MTQPCITIFWVIAWIRSVVDPSLWWYSKAFFAFYMQSKHTHIFFKCKNPWIRNAPKYLKLTLVASFQIFFLHFLASFLTRARSLSLFLFSTLPLFAWCFSVPLSFILTRILLCFWSFHHYKVCLFSLFVFFFTWAVCSILLLVGCDAKSFHFVGLSSANTKLKSLALFIVITFRRWY